MAKKVAATNATPAQVGNQPDQPEAAPAHKADAVSTPTPPRPEDAHPAGADAGGAAGRTIEGVVETIAENTHIGPGEQIDGFGLAPIQPTLTLTITAKRAGFRRAGRAWTVAPTTVDAHDFTPEQLRQLAREDGKMLTITGD